VIYANCDDFGSFERPVFNVKRTSVSSVLNPYR